MERVKGTNRGEINMKKYRTVLPKPFLSPKYYKGNQIKEDKMGRKCNTQGKDEKCI
jgi:hypothetical protein